MMDASKKLRGSDEKIWQLRKPNLVTAYLNTSKDV
jgi:hypothetical protein